MSLLRPIFLAGTRGLVSVQFDLPAAARLLLWSIRDCLSQG